MGAAEASSSTSEPPTRASRIPNAGGSNLLLWIPSPPAPPPHAHSLRLATSAASLAAARTVPRTERLKEGRRRPKPAARPYCRLFGFVAPAIG
ncbi:hypothetical protein MTO96_005811 [Rhipicephalus appendiculatus]